MRLATAVIVAGALVAACSRAPSTPKLAPAQTFNFSAQPVVFAPPAKPWEAEGETSGGLVGVRYVKRGSVGEAIGIADWDDLSRRLRRVELAALLEQASDRRNWEFDHALRKAWPVTDTPYSALETDVARDVTAALRRADAARRGDDPAAVRAELRTALAAAERLHFTFEQVIDRALFDPAKTADPARYRFVARHDLQVAGTPAVAIDYVITLPKGERHMRKVYVMANDHLFVADFIGLEESLPVFDAVVASLSFPQ
jgi:hypothetical protein